MEKTVVELFAGVGGFRCGLNNVQLVDGKVIENNDWNFVLANQWEPSTKQQDAYNCYVNRFGNEDVLNIDISEIDKTEIPDHNLLVGGFPCQDYSVARSKKNEMGIEGKKGVLWWQILDILYAKQPSFVLLENVDRLLISPSKQRGRDFCVMLKCFSEAGYNVEWRVINAADYGMQQKRRRVFIFAYRQQTNYNELMNNHSMENIINNEGLFATTFPITEYTELKQINIKNLSVLKISDNFSERFHNTGVMRDGVITTCKTVPLRENFVAIRDILERNVNDESCYLTNEQIEKFVYLKGNKRIPRVKPNGETYFYTEGQMSFPENLDNPARTMLTSESSINRSTHIVNDLTNNSLRFITPVEAERINGFPDNWTNTGMSNKRRYFMMGNALVVNIINRLEEELNNIFKNIEA